MDYGRVDLMPNYDITFCVPQGHECINTACMRHESKAPENIILSWADFWPTCSEKKEKQLPYPKYVWDK